MPEQRLQMTEDTTAIELGTTVSLLGVFFGITSAMSACLLALFLPIIVQQESLHHVYLPLSALELAGFLFVGKAANDLLIKKQGSLALYGVAFSSLCLAMVGLNLGIPLFGVGLAIALSAAAFILLWAPYLARIARLPLLVALTTSFAGLGLLLVCISSIEQRTAQVIVMLFSFVSGVAALLVRRRDASMPSPVLAQESLDRSARGQHGALSSLFLTGYAFGASVYAMFAVSESVDGLIAPCGFAFIVAASVSLALRYRFEYQFETVLRRFFAILLSLGFLALPFVAPSLQVLCSGFTLTVSACLFMIVIGAISETARFSSLSPFWLTGKEGGLVALGMGLGSALFWWGYSFSSEQIAPIAACLGFVLTASVLQTFLTARRYIVLEEPRAKTAFDENGSGEGDSRESNAFAVPGKGATWRMKIESLANKYSLTLRQKEIIDLYARGRSMSHIAEVFVVSLSTVKTHIHHTYQKLGVHSRQELLDLIEKMKAR